MITDAGQATKRTVNNPFATSVHEQSFQPETAWRALERKATWVDYKHR